MEFHTPWAIVASGIGGASAFLVALATILYLARRSSSTPDQSNMTVVGVEQQPVQMPLLDRKSDQAVLITEEPMPVPNQPMVSPDNMS